MTHSISKSERQVKKEISAQGMLQILTKSKKEKETTIDTHLRSEHTEQTYEVFTRSVTSIFVPYPKFFFIRVPVSPVVLSTTLVFSLMHYETLLMSHKYCVYDICAKTKALIRIHAFQLSPGLCFASRTNNIRGMIQNNVDFYYHFYTVQFIVSKIT